MPAVSAPTGNGGLTRSSSGVVAESFARGPTFGFLRGAIVVSLGSEVVRPGFGPPRAAGAGNVCLVLLMGSRGRQLGHVHAVIIRTGSTKSPAARDESNWLTFTSSRCITTSSVS